MSERPTLPPEITWWNACQTYTWVAFGEARPHLGTPEFSEAEWSRDWMQWPPRGLSQAFVVIATGRAWVTDCDYEWHGTTEEYCRGWANRIIQATGDTPERLNELLAADIEQCERNQGILWQALKDVTAELQSGRLTVFARPAFGQGNPNISADHIPLKATLFLGPRAIDIFGELDYTGEEFGSFDRLRYEGPWFDAARFIAADVQSIWPAVLPPRADILDTMTHTAEAFLAQRGGKPLRDALVKDCVAELKCSYREAETAYRALPPHLRRKRGEKIRDPNQADRYA